MAQVPEIVSIAAERLAAVVARARPIARGVALLSRACGALAYLVGGLVFTGSWRWGWLVVGLVPCLLPAYSLWKAFRRLSRAALTVAALPSALSSLTSDRAARDALFDLAESTNDPESAPLISLG